VALEGAGELADRPGESQVEEQLDPAGVPLLAVVTVRGPQWRAAEVYRVMVAPVTR
jgi:hypothetical protein